jgi:oligopeptidase A
MQYCDNAALREEVYTAYISRASDRGPNAGQWDNSEIMLQIVQLREEMAQLLGFKNYAERSLATKMAETPQQVVDFLNDLSERSMPLARKEFSELEAFAKESGHEKLNAWDVAYYSEKLRESRYALSQEELRPYFPLQKVISGLLSVTARLFSIEFREEKDFERWHDDVQLFSVLRDGDVIAQFYFDLFAREQKRGGAWMADCRVRRRAANDALQLPVAFLTCNFTPETSELPSLLTHNEVTTLFHEFGHGLHHMLTQIDVADVSGINGVAWDAVELPSQFLENWCWASEAIPLLSAHYETGEALPKELLDKMLAAKNFQSGMAMVRQLEFALFDFTLHMQAAPSSVEAIQSVLDTVREKNSVVPVTEDNRFQHGFSHIFAGGYAAGYYSYKWAEVLSADAYSLFEENGIFDHATGQSFMHEVLEMGGAREPMACFEAFRGRKPTVDALLRHSGIV